MFSLLNVLCLQTALYCFGLVATDQIQIDPFKIRRASKLNASDDFVLVEFESTTEPDIYRATFDIEQGWRPDLHLDHEHGSVRVPEPRGLLRVHFYLPHALYILNFNRPLPDTYDEQIPNIDVKVPTALTYDLGENEVDFEISYTSNSGLYRRLHWEVYVTSPPEPNRENTIGHFTEFYTQQAKELAEDASLPDPPMEQTGRGYGQGHQVFYRLRPGHEGKEGMIVFKYDFFDYDSPVMGQRIFHYVPFYRKTHERPFPPDFLAFTRKYEFRTFGLPEPGRLVCSQEDLFCTVRCHAFGPGIEEVEIAKLGPGGESTVVSINRAFENGYLIGGYHFLDKRDPSSSGQYRCTARSNSTEVSKVVTVDVQL